MTQFNSSCAWLKPLPGATLKQIPITQKISLRSDSLQPNWLDGGRGKIINSVVGMRSTYLLEQKLKPVRSSSDLRGGKLLLYFPDADLADGAAEVSTIEPLAAMLVVD